MDDDENLFGSDNEEGSDGEEEVIDSGVADKVVSDKKEEVEEEIIPTEVIEEGERERES
jgi:hypothetical protein